MTYNRQKQIWMNAEDFRAALKTLNLTSDRQACDALRMTDARTLRRYKTGETPVSGPVSLLVEMLMRDAKEMAAFFSPHRRG